MQLLSTSRLTQTAVLTCFDAVLPKDQAYRDADDLQKCAQDNPGDTAKVKAMARDMLNSTLPDFSTLYILQAVRCCSQLRTVGI